MIIDRRRDLFEPITIDAINHRWSWVGNGNASLPDIAAHSQMLLLAQTSQSCRRLVAKCRGIILSAVCWVLSNWGHGSWLSKISTGTDTLLLYHLLLSVVVQGCRFLQDSIDFVLAVNAHFYARVLIVLAQVFDQIVKVWRFASMMIIIFMLDSHSHVASFRRRIFTALFIHRDKSRLYVLRCRSWKLLL